VLQLNLARVPVEITYVNPLWMESFALRLKILVEYYRSVALPLHTQQSAVLQRIGLYFNQGSSGYTACRETVQAQ
jgi:hypothetical protein